MHFFGREAGAGFFIRADIGMAWYEVSSSEADGDNLSTVGMSVGCGSHHSRGEATGQGHDDPRLCPPHKQPHP